MKNKKIVFAIILFLLIGFTIFTFANPSKDEKTFEDNNSKTEDKVDTNKDKNKDSINTDNSDSLNTDENKTDATTNDNGTNSVRNRSNTNIQSNATSTVIVEQSDDKYAKALDAVVKAEGSLSQDDLNTAKDLVGDLDEGEDRNKLQDRIDDVQDIIDVEGLVSTLESKKTSAQNKDEMLSAREYNTSQKIEDAVKNLKDSEAKNNLKKRLDSALKVVNDVNPAEVDGIDEKYTNADSVTLTITDENGYTATLNGDPYESGKEITDEGHYTLKVVDEAFNESEVEFIIDRTSPVVNMSDGKTYEGDEYTYYNSSVTPEIVEENIDTVVLTKDGATVDGYTNGEITDEGKYELTVTDKVGNSVTVKFVIDKTEGTVTFDNNGSDSNSYNNVTVTATINEKYLDKVEYLITPSHTLDDVKKMEFTEAEISEDNTIKITLSELNGTYNIWVKVTDKAGNVSYTKPNNGFKMDNIAPTATVTFDPAGPTNQSVTATIEVSEPIQTPDWWTKIDEEGKKFTKTYDKNGWDTVKIVDLAGNEGSIDVNVTNIDTDDPDLNSIKLYNVTKNLTKEQKHYIKKDQEIMFEVKANEKLVTNDFKVTIGNSTSKFTYSEGSDYYWAKVKINDETSIEEGEVKFTISGYKDLAGNIGTTYGNYENITRNNILWY